MQGIVLARSRAMGLFVLSLGFGALASGVNSQTSTYGYDALGRLTNVSRSDGQATTYTYDAAGNRTQVVMTGQVAVPNPFDLGPAVTAATAGANYESATVTLSGFSGTVPVNITGGAYRLNGGAWTTAGGTATAGQTVQVRVMAPSTAGASQTATLTVGGVSDTFQVTTSTIDITPDAVDWPNLNINTTAETSTAGAGFYQSFTGIDQNINIRVTLDNLSGNLSSVSLQPFDSGTSYGSIQTSGGFLDRAFSAGDSLGFIARASTTSGARTGSFRVTVTNLSTGAVLDTFTVTAAVDTDNNYNTADLTPNAVNWPDLSINTTAETSTAGAGFYQSFGGIDQNINVRVKVDNLTGNLSSILLQPFDSGTSYGSIQTNGGFLDRTFSAGDSLGFIARASTTSGARTGSFRVTVTNLSTGAVLDTFTVTAAVDTDNNYNTVDLTPNAVNWPNLSVVTNDLTGSAGGGFYQTFNGIDSGITVRVAITGYSGNLAGKGLDCYDTDTFYQRLSGNGFVDRTFTAGKKLGFIAWGTSSGGAQSGSWTVTITNMSTGQVLDTFLVSVNVDADGG